MRRLFYGLALGCLALMASVRAATITSLGVLYVGEECRLELPFHNESPDSVTIDGAETSCECLVPRFTRTEIPAGETRLLKFSYRTTAVGRMRVDIDYVSASVPTFSLRHSVVGIVVARDEFLSVDRLRDFLKTRNPVLIDVRRSDRFEAARLPRSINVPHFALRHRTDLKTRDLVLVDEGFAPTELAEQAEALRRNGFRSVSVLEGGIAAWVRAGGPVEGTGAAAHVTARITAAEFLRIQTLDPWPIVHLTAATLPMLPDIRVGSDVGRVPTRVLVVASTDSEYAPFESRDAARGDLRVFYLSGGEQALAAYQVDQSRMSSNPGAVFQSKSTQAHVVATSGCGTCPR
jgi:rhodanese-related sulfurtransferase